MTTDGLDEIMAAIGPETPGVAAVAAGGEDRFAVAFDDGREVGVERDRDAELVTLSLVLGTPGASRRPGLREAALRYNARWRDTGGLRIGAAGRGGEFVLMLALPVAELTLETMRTGLAWLRAQGAVWAEAIAGEEEAGGAAPEPTMIRG